MGDPSFWKTSLPQPQTLKSTQMPQGQLVMGDISRATSRFNGVWTKEQQLDPKREISVAYQELYPIVLSALLWGGQWTNKRLVFRCDNQAMVHAINKGTSRSHPVAHLLRLLTLKSYAV